MNCEHVYKDLGPGPCPKCGLETHTTDWKKQNKMMKQWHKDNPDAGYIGWMSIWNYIKATHGYIEDMLCKRKQSQKLLLNVVYPQWLYKGTWTSLD